MASILSRPQCVNPCCAEFVLQTKIRLHFLAFLNTEMVQVVLRGKQEPIYPAHS